MVRKTKEEAQQTREQILDSAILIFAQDGVAKASLEAIAKHAGVTRGAVYWHFKSKSDIFEALHDVLHQPLMNTLLHDLDRDHSEPLTQIEELCVQLLTDLAHDEHRKKILEIFYLKCDYSGDMARFLDKQSEQKQEGLTLFTKYFDKAQRKGHISREIPPEGLAVGLMCYMKGIIVESLRSPNLIKLAERAPCLMRQYFCGLRETGDN